MHQGYTAAASDVRTDGAAKRRDGADTHHACSLRAERSWNAYGQLEEVKSWRCPEDQLALIPRRIRDGGFAPAPKGIMTEWPASIRRELAPIQGSADVQDLRALLPLLHDVECPSPAGVRGRRLCSKRASRAPLKPTAADDLRRSARL